MSDKNSNYLSFVVGYFAVYALVSALYDGLSAKKKKESGLIVSQNVQAFKDVAEAMQGNDCQKLRNLVETNTNLFETYYIDSGKILSSRSCAPL